MVRLMMSALFGVTSLVSCAAAKVATRDIEISRERAGQTNAATVCRHDRVIASTQGRIAVFRDPHPLLLGPRRSNVLVVEAALIVEPDGGATRVRSRAREIDILGFDADGRLGLLLDAGTRVSIGAKDHASEALLERRNPDHRFGPSRQGAVSIRHKSAADGAEDVVRQLTFQGWERPVTLQVIDREGRLLVRTDGAALAGVVPIGHNQLRSFRDADGRIRISYAGEEVSAGNGLLAAALTDSLTGERVGLFGPRQLRLFRPVGRPIDVAKVMSPTDLLLDATVAGEQLYLLVEDWAGNRRLDTVDLDSRRQTSRRLCSTPVPQTVPPGVVIDNVTVVNARGGAAMPGLLTRNERQTRSCLVVYYHGGPDLSIKDSGFGHYKELATGTECDTLALAYSGSAGAGPQLSRQLKLGGFAALEADARAVQDWVARHQQYKRVSVVGVSFGAAPALALKMSFGPRADAYLVGPVVSLSIIRNLERPILGILNIGGKSHFAASADMLYGSAGKQDDFDRQLAEAYRSLSANDHVFAGLQDDKSPPTELRQLTGQAEVHLRPGNHDLITGFGPFYRNISDLITARSRMGQARPANLPVAARRP